MISTYFFTIFATLIAAWPTYLYWHNRTSIKAAIASSPLATLLNIGLLMGLCIGLSLAFFGIVRLETLFMAIKS